MKSTSTTTILFIAAAAVIAPDQAQGREAILSDEDKGQRRLFFSSVNYKDIYDRCCKGEDGEDDEAGKFASCNCPKRLNTQTSLLDALLFGKDKAKSYKEKWDEQCADDGWLAKKANNQPN